MDRHFTIYDGTDIIDEGDIDVDWTEVRLRRNQALADSDWRAGKDVVLSTAWKDYRQALRDLPQDHAESNDAADAWPVMPDA
jgi:hypothetical protein